MKKILDEVIAMVSRELGYYDDSMTDAFCAAMDRGVSVADFVDGVLDSAVFG